MRLALLAATTAALGVLGAGAAFAEPVPPAPDYVATPQAVIGGDYNYISVPGGSANVYGGSVGGSMPLWGPISGQITGGYHTYQASNGESSGNFDQWSVGAAGVWNFGKGRAGISGTYSGLNFHSSESGSNGDAWSYGVYGEYYPCPKVTLGLHGGGVTLGGGGFSETGGYVGAQAAGYYVPDLMLQGHVEYAGIDRLNQTNVGVKAEYLFSRTVPISGWIGYDYTNFSTNGSGSFDANAFLVGINVYFGGDAPLVTRHRTGVDTWGPAAVSLLRF
jgi:hypothetical protein